MLMPDSILERAEELAGLIRSADYGHPYDDFTRSARMWAPILGLDEVTPEQVALCMIAVKVSRLCATPGHHDSIVDIAGYARCYELVRERR